MYEAVQHFFFLFNLPYLLCIHEDSSAIALPYHQQGNTEQMALSMVLHLSNTQTTSHLSENSSSHCEPVNILQGLCNYLTSELVLQWSSPVWDCLICCV